MYGLCGLKHHIVEISGDVTDAGRDKRTTSEDSATQLLICEPLSFTNTNTFKSKYTNSRWPGTRTNKREITHLKNIV